MTTVINEIHVGDIGVKFIVTIKDGADIVNISTASTKELIFEKPGGDCLIKTTSFVTDGSDGKMYWETNLITDLDEAGEWLIQGKIVMPILTAHTNKDSFKVYENIECPP
jgi:hypothetical protein